MNDTTRANVLLFFPDQHRGDWMPYDQPVFELLGMEPLPLRMPNVRALMDQGVTFYRAVTPSPLCAPARACLAAGLRYEACQVPHNGYDYPLDQPTFYSVLRDLGYRVGGVGKFDLHKATHWWGLDGWIDELGTLGFTDGIDNAGKIDAIVSGRESPRDPYMKFLYDRGLTKLHIKDMTARQRDKKMVEPTPLPEEAYCDNWLTSNGIQMLRQFPEGQPWFLQVNFTGPHNPWDVTERMRAGWSEVPFPPPVAGQAGDEERDIAVRQNYAAMLENIDRNIGLLLQEVARRGELERTVVIYSADHGEMLGDFGTYGKSRPERGSVHIPLVIRAPGCREAICSGALVELQDLTATILDYAGGSMPTACDSLSLRPIVEGAGDTHRQVQRSALNLREDHGWKMVSDSRYQLIEGKGQRPRLYDLCEDPWGLKDIAAERTDVVERLSQEL